MVLWITDASRSYAARKKYVFLADGGRMEEASPVHPLPWCGHP
jgi:hypothetical protein